MKKNLKNIMLSGRSQPQLSTYCMIFTGNSREKNVMYNERKQYGALKG